MNIHLERIAAHTTVPYTIYGLINPNPARTLPGVLRTLEKTPHMKIVRRHRPNLSFFARGEPVVEHAYYLDQLAKVAVKDECTHVATLHVDSFPVKTGWAQSLSRSLDKKCVLAAIQRSKDENDRKPHPSGMIFTAGFYKKYRPTFRLPIADFSSPDYKEYKSANDGAIIGDSGVGYGFRIWEEGLSWLPLTRSNKHQDHHIFGGIYGDYFFHVGAAVRKATNFSYRAAGEKVMRKLYENPKDYIKWLRGVS